jgi:hypothetical protein
MTALLTTLALATGVHAADPVPYPEGYRHWSHVKSMTIHPGHPLEDPFLGIHHVYANPAALRGLRTGTYPEGAILVFDQLEYETAEHASTEGPRVLLGVMVKDQSRFRETGGWGYEAWKGDSREHRLVGDGGKSCHACHAERAEDGYVFSEWRD